MVQCVAGVRTDEEVLDACPLGVLLPPVAREEEHGLGALLLLEHALERLERPHPRHAELDHVQHVPVERAALQIEEKRNGGDVG